MTMELAYRWKLWGSDWPKKKRDLRRVRADQLKNRWKTMELVFLYMESVFREYTS